MTTNRDHLKDMRIDGDDLIVALNRIKSLLDELAALRKENESMREALLVALPYVTDAEGFPEQFKPGVVRHHVKQVRAAIGDRHEG